MFQHTLTDGNGSSSQQYEHYDEFVPFINVNDDDDLPELEKTDDSEDFQALVNLYYDIETDLNAYNGQIDDNDTVPTIPPNCSGLEVFVLKNYDLFARQGLVDINYIDINDCTAHLHMKHAANSLNTIDDTTNARGETEHAEHSLNTIDVNANAHGETEDEEETEEMSFCA